MKHIIVLVGPKGASKTTIGDLLERTLGVPFARVEPVFLRIHKALGASHPDYERKGFEAVLALLSSELARADTICFESTAASKQFPWLLGELGKIAKVSPVRVLAESQQCIDRIHQRDASLHIPVSDEQVSRINAAAMRVDLPWASEIDNRGLLAPERIVCEMRSLLQRET